MFKGLDADLYFTGELTHHEALAAKENGISVIACKLFGPWALGKSLNAT